MKTIVSLGLVLGLSTTGSAQVFEVFHAKSEGKWTAKVSYPQFLALTLVNGAANPDVKATAKSAFDSFVKDARQFEASGWSGHPWSMEMEPTIGLMNAGIVSVMWSGYSETGGANPMTFYVSRTYSLTGENQWGRVNLEAFLKPGVDKQAFAREAVVPRLNAIKKERGLDEWDEMTESLADSFVVTPAGITWLFSKYDVGAGVEGMYEIKVQWNEMPEGLDREGILAGLIEASANTWEVSGKLNWQGSATVPQGAIAEFRIFEPIADKPAEFLQTQRVPIRANGQSFLVKFDKSKLNPDRQYQVEARVLVEDEVWMRNDTALFLPESGSLGEVGLIEINYPEMERPWMRLQGTIGYRERMMVPPGSILRFKLVRASREAGDPILQQKTFRFTGVGMPFDVTFANKNMKAGPHFIEITLESEGKVMFRSEPLSVASWGWESAQEITLRRSSGI